MRLIYCQCGEGAPRIDAPYTLPLPPIPSRADLRPIDAAAAELLPHDDTPSLDEIQASPEVPHMGEPRRAPQRPTEPLRIVVGGTDAALGAVLTRLMRADALWAEVAYLPADPTSPAAVAWGDPSFEEAAAAPVVPSPCLRNDFGEVVAGAATLTHVDPSSEFVGEIVVDSEVLLMRSGAEPSARFFGSFGARLVPTPGGPGLVAAPVVTPRDTGAGRTSRLDPASLERLRRLPGGRLLTSRSRVPAALTDGSHVLAGRALQAGGRDILVTVDGVARRRPVGKAAFYRHLRDIQSVKTAAGSGM